MKAYKIANSKIHGRGLFSNKDLKSNEIIGLVCTFKNTSNITSTSSINLHDTKVVQYKL